MTFNCYIFALPPPSPPPPVLLAVNSLSLTPLDTSEARGLDQKLGYNGGAVRRLFTAGRQAGSISNEI